MGMRWLEGKARLTAAPPPGIPDVNRTPGFNEGASQTKCVVYHSAVAGADPFTRRSRRVDVYNV
jgi:hypothetical protein